MYSLYTQVYSGTKLWESDLELERNLESGTGMKPRARNGNENVILATESELEDGMGIRPGMGMRPRKLN